jgi:pimeloyl-ACP methyl ester carboxylesterase
MVRKLVKGMAIFVSLILVGVSSVYVYNTEFIERRDPGESAPERTKFIDIEGETLAYSEIDNRAPTTVVFVGGLSAWNGTWERTIVELNSKQKNYNYIALDLPPFGFSTPDQSKGYFRDVQAQRIAAFVKAKKMQRIVLVGHSYGGGPVTEYVLKNPAKVEKLILIDAVLNIDETKIIDTHSPAQFGFLRGLLIGILIHNDSFALSRLKSFVFVTDHIDKDLLAIYTKYFDTEGVTERLSQWFGDYLNDPLTYLSNASENYKNLTIPVRLIWGDKDTLTPLSGTEIILTTVPDIQLQTLQNVGHIPMIEDYELFDQALFRAFEK